MVRGIEGGLPLEVGDRHMCSRYADLVARHSEQLAASHQHAKDLAKGDEDAIAQVYCRTTTAAPRVGVIFTATTLSPLNQIPPSREA